MGGIMIVKHTLKLFAVAAAFVAVVAVVWSGSAPVGGAGASSAPVDQVSVSPGAPNASVVLPPTQDAWIDAAAPTLNFGSDPRLHVAFTGTVAALNRYTLLGFDLSPLPSERRSLAPRFSLSDRSPVAPRHDVILTQSRRSLVRSHTHLEQQTAVGQPGCPAVTLDTTNGWKTWDVTNIVKVGARGAAQLWHSLAR
jgi:hypothetical protein